PDALKAAPKSGVITNKHLAYMQRQCGYYAGETELEQWLMLERNRDRMVVVIDSQTGFESITYFQRDADGESIDKERFALAELGSTKSEVKHQIRAVLADVFTNQNAADLQQSQSVALYRTRVHWQRIVGLAPTPSVFFGGS
ncbi:MAG: hypothetical protein H7315_22750, partial [Herminiimonas sp.]|nr:hypothetical protein [Herminiimonas sp.]